jgi:hypothetical protein
MIPLADIDFDSHLPAEATFWIPDEEFLEEADEGFGFFRDVWVILDVPLPEVAQMLSAEQSILALIDEAVDNPNDFDAVASAIEHADIEAIPAHIREGHSFERLQAEIDFEFPPFDGLEVGAGPRQSQHSDRLTR